MKRISLIFVVVLSVVLMLNGCREANGESVLLQDMQIVRQRALYLFDTADGNNNILYLKGYMRSKKDISLLGEYFNSGDIQTKIGNDDGDPVSITNHNWEFNEEDKHAVFNLLLICSDLTFLPHNIKYLYISDDNVQYRYEIGDYQIYENEISSPEIIFPAYSPFAFSSAPEYGVPFTVSYHFLLNTGNDDSDICFSVMLPDDYDALEVIDVSYSYSEQLTDEYISASENENSDEVYENCIIYVVDVTYRQTKDENIHFQPLIAAEAGSTTLFCRPFAPFFLFHEIVSDK